MAGEKVGEAYVELHYRLDGLTRDLQAAKTRIDGQVEQINRSVQQKTGGMFSGVGTQLQGVTALTGAFGAAILAAVGSQALQAVNAFKDRIAQTGAAFQQMQARLDQSLGAGAFDETIAMANRLGVAIKDAADSTARFGMAAQDIGLTREQTLLLTETVVKLGRIGNSSAQEMSAGMMQLAQSLASGKFQGDELRSVLEQMPEVARAIARELGVSIGKLREMGSEGQLTADVVAQALLRAADDASARFAKLPETLEQSQARWENAANQLFAALDRAWGASSFVKWWTKFKTDLAEGITVDLGGGTTETQIKVLTDRLESLRNGNWFGENDRLIAEVEQQLKSATMFARMAGDNSRGDTGAPAKFTGPSAWSLYQNPTLEDAKALKGYRDDAQEIARAAQQTHKQQEAEAERHAAEMTRLEDARRDDLRRDIEATVKEEEDRVKKVRETNEKLAKVAQEARRNELAAEKAKREKDIRDDPGGYYARTHDAELAPIYDASTGARDAMKELGDASMQYGRMLGDGIKQGADIAAKAMTDFALTGKLAIGDFLKSLAEMALNQAFQMMIGAGLGAAGSYMFGAPGAPQGGAGGGPRGYALGGVFNAGHVMPLARGGVVSAAHIVPLARGAAVIGEAGPEAVMPLGRDSSGRLGVRGGGQHTNVQIIDQRGHGAPPAQVEQRQNGSGGMDVRVLIQAEVSRAIGGGHADKAMRERFAMQPAVRR